MSRNPAFGKFQGDDEVAPEYGGGVGTISHNYDTGAVSTLAALDADALNELLRGARVRGRQKAEIEDAIVRWRDGGQVVLSDSTGKACTRLAAMLSLRSTTVVESARDRDTCTDCRERGCPVEDGLPTVACRPCGGTGRVATSATRQEVGCPNCGGRGRHRCRCTRCHV